ncbi:hypothetical protein J5277_10720 [Rhizobium sp. 16-449-1b]|uniref:hypothetical protein n=1 Tax=Rhizobium sp. 16-449-1b TaxID=2819989 RepID=UPI001ADC0098|nr:hypothetical protein [Rhizobium sp. 16-449-1b]MBO9194581.1 hypothetical protein [Rhizobium sp. 16-449-1b]
MTKDCMPLVEVSIQRDGRLIPLGIMTTAQALDLPHRHDFVFVNMPERAGGRELPRAR